jgi:hypothetical protein
MSMPVRDAGLSHACIRPTMSRILPEDRSRKVSAGLCLFHGAQQVVTFAADGVATWQSQPAWTDRLMKSSEYSRATPYVEEANDDRSQNRGVFDRQGWFNLMAIVCLCFLFDSIHDSQTPMIRVATCDAAHRQHVQRGIRVVVRESWLQLAAEMTACSYEKLAVWLRQTSRTRLSAVLKRDDVGRHAPGAVRAQPGVFHTVHSLVASSIWSTGVLPQPALLISDVPEQQQQQQACHGKRAISHGAPCAWRLLTSMQSVRPVNLMFRHLCSSEEYAVRRIVTKLGFRTVAVTEAHLHQRSIPRSLRSEIDRAL